VQSKPYNSESFNLADIFCHLSQLLRCECELSSERGKLNAANDPTGNGNGGLSDKIMIVYYLILSNYEEICEN